MTARNHTVCVLQFRSSLKSSARRVSRDQYSATEHRRKMQELVALRLNPAHEATSATLRKQRNNTTQTWPEAVCSMGSYKQHAVALGYPRRSKGTSHHLASVTPHNTKLPGSKSIPCAPSMRLRRRSPVAATRTHAQGSGPWFCPPPT